MPPKKITQVTNPPQRKQSPRYDPAPEPEDENELEEVFVDDTTNDDSPVVAEDSIHSPAQIAFCKKFLKRLDELIWIHSRSAEFYDKLHNRVMAPSIIITGVGGVASFLSTNSTFSTGTRDAFNVSVGILASISTVLQSLMGAFGFQTKAQSHRSAAEEYHQLYVKVNFELALPNEPDFLSTLEQKMLEITNKCKYFPPQFIVDQYKRST